MKPLATKSTWTVIQPTKAPCRFFAQQEIAFVFYCGSLKANVDPLSDCRLCILYQPSIAPASTGEKST